MITQEEDPNGIGQHDDGAKLDKGKPDASLLGYFGQALLAVSEVGTHGAKKYTRGGWQHVPDGINRYTAAMLRHFFQENQGKWDSDLPVLHAAQVAWNALARLELILREEETKERWSKEIEQLNKTLRPCSATYKESYQNTSYFTLR
jgi:hypothetical protein